MSTLVTSTSALPQLESSFARIAMRWAAITIASAAPTAWRLLEHRWHHAPESCGVGVGIGIWAFALALVDYRSARAGRPSPNPTLLLGAKIQAVALAVAVPLTHGFGLLAIYFPVVILAIMAFSFGAPILRTLDAPADLLTFATYAALTVACGGMHVLSAIGLGILFRPIERSRRQGRSKLRTTQDAVTGTRSA